MMTITALTDQEGEPRALICVNDVTEGVRLREQLTFRATHDPLTGCLNRSAVLHELEDRLAQPSGNETALIFVDVDELKPVNDQLGHAAGDELLIDLARCLRHLSRTGDFVGRLGGDEFVLVCCDVPSHAEAVVIAERALDTLNQPASLLAGSVDLSVSMGVARPAPGSTPAQTLIARADAAMYCAKQRHDAEPVLAADITGAPDGRDSPCE